MKDLISVIIPVYNGENDIKKCIDSVINQTYKNLEIIIINDGSTDNTFKILKEYKNKYGDKLVVIDQKNKGQAIARNNGIKKSTGKYITFLDADDYLKKDFIYILHKNIGLNDFIVSGYIRTMKDQILFKKIPSNNEWAKFKFVSTCAKLYRKDFIIKNKILFPTIRIGEDVYFTMKALSYTNKVKILDYAGYMNESNEKSITHTINKNNKESIITILNKIENELDENYISIDNKLFFYVKSVVLDMITHKDILTKVEFNKEYKFNFNWLVNVYKSNSKKLKFKWMSGEERHINLVVNLFIICYKLNLENIIYFMLKIFLRNGIK